MFMINGSAATCKNCMVLIRLITLHSLIHNVHVFAKHVSTHKNLLADALSRLNLSKFRCRVKRKIDRFSTMVPEAIWPIKKIWVD